MAGFDELLDDDPRGAGAAREADKNLEQAIKSGLSNFEGLNSAVESGKKHAWPLLLIIFSVLGGSVTFAVKSTLFYAEQAQFQATVKQNQADGKAFREATTARLDAIDRAQRAAEQANRDVLYEQRITNNRLADIAQTTSDRLDRLEGITRKR